MKCIKNSLFLIVWSLVIPLLARAQDIFVCRHAGISFYSSAPIEDIEAVTDQAVSAINLRTGTVYFKVAVSSFQFEHALMQEHFNSHYMESDRYPYAVFKGKMTDPRAPDSSGLFPVTVSGDLTIHGVTKAYVTKGVLELKDGQLGVTSGFIVRLSDHGIRVPRLFTKNIAEVVKVKVWALYDVGSLLPAEKVSFIIDHTSPEPVDADRIGFDPQRERP